MELLCPVCGEVLAKGDHAMVCPNGHSFDIARQGYCNLLTVQQKHSAAPGDTLQQVRSRRTFLEGGFYAPICDALIQAAKEYGASGELLDIGCGEGYYSGRLAAALNLSLTGVDISKEAVRYAAGSWKNAKWVCATAAHLPLKDGSADVLTSLFALTLPDEFHRVLKKGGLFFQVLAAQDHLLGLKRIIYKELVFKEKDTTPQLAGFTLLQSIPIRFSFTVEGAQVQNLLSMTPHVYRITKEGAQRLAEVSVLNDTASVMLNVFARNPD